jgi:hypothetical protein
LNALNIQILWPPINQTLLHGLFPAVRAEVLRLLFMNRGQELYTRELARLSFLALRTIQEELAKLKAASDRKPHVGITAFIALIRGIRCLRH